MVWRTPTTCLWILAALLLGGCRGPGGFCGPPGTLEQQQRRAILHDPYADNDAGPELVGLRPRDYEKPLPEPVRSRTFRDAWWYAPR